MIKGGVSKDMITVVPSFVDTDKIEPCYKNKKYFLFFGRMSVPKGLIYAIKAFNELNNSDYKLLITGDFSDLKEENNYSEIKEYKKKNDNIVFTGFKKGKELDDIINNCIAVICPSIWYENMPNTVVEAYAHGKPVIASDIGSLSELVIDNETGFLFETKNYKDLAEKMSKFISDPEIAVELGKNSRLFCVENFNMKQHIDKLIEIFEEK